MRDRTRGLFLETWLHGIESVQYGRVGFERSLMGKSKSEGRKWKWIRLGPRVSKLMSPLQKTTWVGSLYHPEFYKQIFICICNYEISFFFSNNTVIFIFSEIILLIHKNNIIQKFIFCDE